ncbi:hypothetical protein [Aquimarina sp. I32.4]|uniref:hypothetical protein n=1 Tax=Aquimarina sp. I32.4 TaxID=2053903 RepID=UPI0011AFBF48|nr:hypothetical protein [Aquimarina sp. I32.4]
MLINSIVALTGMAWIYWVALIIAYPFGLISLLIWLTLKKENKKRTKWIPRILTTGLVLSIGILTFFLIWE